MHNSAKSLLKCAAASAVLAFLLQLVGVSGPAWLVITAEVPEFAVQVGIWYIRICELEYPCLTIWKDKAAQISKLSSTSTLESLRHSIENVGEILDSSGWEEFQAETTLALMCVVFAMVVILVASKRVERRPVYLTIAASVASLLSAILVFVPLGKCCAAMEKTRDVDLLSVQGSNEGMHFDLPWALVVSGVGGFFVIISCILSLYAVYNVPFGTSTNEMSSTHIQPTELEFASNGHIADALPTIHTYPVPQTEYPESKSPSYPILPPPHPIPHDQMYAYDQDR